MSRLNTWLLWITVVTGFGGVGTWAVTVLPQGALQELQAPLPVADTPGPGGSSGGRPALAAHPPIPAMRTLWVGLMAIWLAALVFGAWWVWPHLERMTLSADLIISLVWLVIGAAAWLVALNLGNPAVLATVAAAALGVDFADEPLAGRRANITVGAVFVHEGSRAGRCGRPAGGASSEGRARDPGSDPRVTSAGRRGR